ncbi:MAG: polysaccharide deacetylase family protein [Pseudomonadales bacterium]
MSDRADRCAPPHLALKVDVDTYRGTLEGVPALLELLAEFDLHATLLFSIGPDHTGRALRRVLRPGFLSKVRRTSVASHYGVKTLLYGVLLPGPHIARRAGQIMRAALDAGHEVGVHAYDHVLWQDKVARRGHDWTWRQMQLAWDGLRDALGVDPATAGAAGWQINGHALAAEDAFGLRYASDVRGEGPFRPVMDGIASRCVQIPTTLPTLDELLGLPGLDQSTLAAHLLGLTADVRRSQVYTLHAELEGMKLRGVFRDLLAGWSGQGYRLGTLGDTFATLDAAALPRREVIWGSVPGRSGRLACAGAIANGSSQERA